MEKLQQLLMENLNEQLLLLTISAPRSKEGPSRIRLRPLMKKGVLFFQAASQIGKQEFHENLTRDEAAVKILAWMEKDFKQLQMETAVVTAQALVSKKGTVTVKQKKKQQVCQAPADLSHNRKKHYLLEEGIPVPFLQDLGVMTAEGKIVHAHYDKFRQINRFLEFIEDILPKLPKDREVSILDFGCGKSYLTFAMYYYLRERKGLDVRIIGLDLKQEVIEHCSRLAREYGYEKLTFLTGDIASYTGSSQVDMVVTLHACDTATDYALEKAVRWNAKVILSVPCSQHELNGQIHCEDLEPVLKYGLLKERMAALITDGLRAARLEEAGYQVQILEFIDMEHTPKNILIRAVRTGQKHPEKHAEYERCREILGVDPLLGRLLDKEV
ncbi:MAG: SAM-dependent methyltransferase [Candidatus Limivivens sp.]|nr:SAM-dependent methyltransferase [Candidatus Limivivens sp.]